MNKPLYATIFTLSLISSISANVEEKLLHAAEYGDLPTVQEMITQGANPNCKTTDGYTPLHLAALWGHGDVVQDLLARPEIVVDATNSLGATPLMMASQGLTKDYQNKSRSGNDSTIIIDALLQAGANPNHTDWYEGTALMWAASNGLTNIMQRLLNNGADLHHTDRWHKSALTNAISEKKENAETMLRRLGATIPPYELFVRPPKQKNQTKIATPSTTEQDSSEQPTATLE